MFVRKSTYNTVVSELHEKHHAEIADIVAAFAGAPDEFDRYPVKDKVLLLVKRLGESSLLRKQLAKDLARKSLECQALEAELAPLKAARDARLANLTAANERRRAEAQKVRA